MVHVNAAPAHEVTWQRSPRVVERALAGSCVLLDRDSGESMSLRRSGALLWAALAVPGSSTALTEAVVAIDESIDSSEVMAVLRTLNSAGFVGSS